MIQLITDGIKISVQSKFEGSYFDGESLKFAFKYVIEIENNNPYAVQLMSRKWNVLDALNIVETVEGEGVIGKKPIIKSFNSYRYNSGCLLHSPIGAMNGLYKMIRLTDNHEFDVQIPNFKLYSKFAQN